MSSSDVTKEGLKGVQPGRDAMVGVVTGKRKRGGEQPMVPDPKFSSYYGKPVINKPIWEAPDIAGYFFLGGLSGAASVIALGADVTGLPVLAKVSKVGAFASIALGLAGLVHDLGRPSRFTNMLRVFKPTSPMSVGSWLLAGYAPAAGVAAGTAVTGRLPRLGAVATASAAAAGPFVASYTAALMCDTAVPSWHEGFREMPFVFVGSGASAAGGLGMVATPVAQAGPARRAAAFGAALEIGAARLMEHRMGEPVSDPYHKGKSGKSMRIAEGLTIAGAVGGVVFGRRSRIGSAVCGAALVAASALTRFAIFEAGMVSAQDPTHTVRPQRQRLEQREATEAQG